MHAIQRLGTLVHLFTPILIVLVALAYHGLGHPLPTLTLITLISGAYGKALWHEFLETRTIRATVHRTESSDRDVLLGVEPTSPPALPGAPRSCTISATGPSSTQPDSPLRGLSLPLAPARY
jgi:hypothetical protein